ncbi:MAG: BatA domain-containing protein [Lentisphaeria bacterium]|nr:BatA domain-containing protein [Lentisphaeria bacterium]
MITYPLAALALIGLPLAVAIYALHNRYRRMPVSSLMLWRQLRKAAPGGVVVQRVVFPLLLLLELLALLLIALAALDPRWQSWRRQRPITIILDNSASMLFAQEGGGQTLATARAALRRRIKEGNYSPVRLILADDTPIPVSPRETAHFLTTGNLSVWDGSSSRSDIKAAVHRALASGEDPAALLVIADHAPPPGDADFAAIHWLAFGHPSPNIGFIDARRADSRGSSQCALTVLNHTPIRQVVPVVLTNGDHQETRTVDLAPGAARRFTVSLKDAKAPLTARLPDDAFALDNHVILLPAAPRPVRVIVAVGNPVSRPLVERAVEATGLAQPAVAQPDLVITDQPDRAVPAGCWRFDMISPAEPKSLAGPFFADSAHPLLDGVSLRGVIWGARPGAILPGDPVVTSAATSLLSETRRSDGSMAFHMQFSPSVSTLQLSPSWPTLFHNLLTLRGNHLPGFTATNIRAGGRLRGACPEDVETPSLQLPDQTDAPLAPGRFDLPVRQPGIYRLRAGSFARSAAVNFLNAEESDPRNRLTAEFGHQENLERRHHTLTSATPGLSLAALAILLVHQYLTRKRGG